MSFADSFVVVAETFVVVAGTGEEMEFGGDGGGPTAGEKRQCSEPRRADRPNTDRIRLHSPLSY